MKKKFFSMLLVLLLLVPLSIVLTSCGGGSSDDNTTVEHTHTYDQKSTDSKFLASEASCTAKAKYYYSCSCGEKGSSTFEYGEVDSSNHTGELEWITTETTHKQVYSCCGKVEVAETNHTGGSATTTEKAVCEVCGKTYGEFHTHTYNQENTDSKYLASEATCIAKAKYYYSCLCGKKGTETFESGELVSHTSSDWIIDTDATHTTEGSKHKECSVCHTILETATIEKLTDHTYNQEVAISDYLASAATCISKAKYYYSCSCGKYGTETFELGELASHISSNWIIDTHATHTTEGSKHKECSVCHTTLETVTIEKLITHTYNQEVATSDYLASEATCIAKAKYYYSCLCGKKGTETFESGELVSHTSSDWIIDTDATHTTEGLKYKECSVCHTTLETTTIDKLTDHIYNQEVATSDYLISKATCTAKATYYKSCICGEKGTETFESGEFDSTNHTGTLEWFVSKTTHQQQYSCCKSLVDDAVAHNFVDNICSDCNYDRISKGLVYTLSTDKTYYEVTGIGTCVDESVVIPSIYEGLPVTSIGSSAFKNCKSLTSIIIPDSVTSIGSYAFNNCNSLISIIIPDSVTSIGSYAFYYCTSLISITIPSTVTSIGKNAFRYCYKLVEVYNLSSASTTKTYLTSYALDVYTSTDSTSKLHTTSDEYIFYEDEDENTVYLIGYTGSSTTLTLPNKYNDKSYDMYKYAFYNCTSITNVYYNGTIESWCNITFNNSTSNPMSYANHFYLLNSETKNYEEVTEIEIPDTITTIGNYQFYGFVNVLSITIPSSVTSIEDSAFYDCSKLIEVYNLSDLEITAGSNNNGYVGYYALNVYTKNEGSSNLHKTEDGLVFYGYAENIIEASDVYLVGYTGSSTSVTLPNYFEYNNMSFSYSVKSYAFDGTKITDITIGGHITRFEEGAFNNCLSLTNVYYNGTLAEWCNIEFDNIYSTPMSYASNFYLLNSNTNEYEELVNVVLDDDVKSLKNFTFYNFKSLESITISKNVTSIGAYAFYECTSLISVTIPNNVESIKNNAFDSCSSLKSITIPNSVTSIASNVFYDCSSLESITVPFVGASIDSSSDGTSKCYFYYIFDEISENIPSTLTSVTILGGYIPYNAFSNCSNITSIALGDDVTGIGEDAFSDCTSLEYNSYDNAYYLGNDTNPCLVLVKAKDTSITSCEINSSTKFLYQEAFINCISLTSITIPDSVTSIGKKLFEECTSLASLTISKNITNIGIETFSNCASLSSITIPENVSSIGYGAFYGCSNLESITIPDSVTSIGLDVFSGCTSLKYNEYENACYLGNDTNSYLVLVVAKDTSITSCTINENTKIIYHEAFSNCASLTNITLTSSVASIGYDVFENCTSLTNVYYNGSIESWCNIAFSNQYSNPMYYANENSGNIKFLNSTSGEYEKVTEIEIPNTITTIGAYQFCGFSNVTSFAIPDSITTIRKSAFYNCTSLTTIYYKGTSAEWSNIYKITNGNSYLTSATCYYYSESNPFEGDDAVSEGNYWHYDTNGKIAVWENTSNS